MQIRLTESRPRGADGVGAEGILNNSRSIILRHRTSAVTFRNADVTGQSRSLSRRPSAGTGPAARGSRTRGAAPVARRASRSCRARPGRAASRRSTGTSRCRRAGTDRTGGGSGDHVPHGDLPPARCPRPRERDCGGACLPRSPRERRPPRRGIPARGARSCA